MPTLNKLEYLDETKQQIKNALNTNFNSQIQDTDTFRSYVSKINDIYTNWAKVTGEDTTLSLTPTKKGLMKVELKGNTSQDGTPTPDTPIPIKVVTGEQNVKIQNKNLFDYTKHNALTLNSNGRITTTKYYTQDNGVIYKLKPNTKYTFSFRNSNMGFSNYGLSMTLNGTWVQTISGKYTLTSDSNGEFTIKLGADSYNTIGKASAYIQLEEGSTVTSYEPYQSQTYPISLSSIELAKIGNYKDYIFKNVTGSPYYNANLDLNGWYLKNYYDIHTINNTDISLISSYWYDSTGCYGAGMSKSLLNLPNGVLDKESLCNISKKISNNTSIAENTYSFIANADYIFFFGSSFDTLENAKGILAGAKIMCELATPTNTKITDTTLIQQLENINNNAHSYKDTTYIICSSASTDNEVIVANVSALMKGV